MNVRRWAALAAILVLGVVIGRTTGIVAQDDKSDKTAPDKLAVQCAEANLKLAQMNLDRMKQLNQKVRGTLISGMIDQFTAEVELAQQELDVAKSSPGGNPYQSTVERMRLALKTAEARAKRALDTHEQAPDIVSKNDVERMRQIAVIADLELQRGLSLEKASPQQQLQWQLEIYGNEIDRVRVYTYLLGQNRFGEFSPGL